MRRCSFWPRWLQPLLGNRLMRFLSVISMNLYIWHQVLSVQIAQHWFPEGFPQVAERNLQWAFTVLCFSVSVLVAMAFTYGLEQPCAKWIHQGVQRLTKKNHSEKEECSR